jgi:hypothetical protein
LFPSGVLIGRMPYRANEGGALVSRVVNYIKEISLPPFDN